MPKSGNKVRLKARLRKESWGARKSNPNKTPSSSLKLKVRRSDACTSTEYFLNDDFGYLSIFEEVNDNAAVGDISKLSVTLPTYNKPHQQGKDHVDACDIAYGKQRL